MGTLSFSVLYLSWIFFLHVPFLWWDRSIPPYDPRLAVCTGVLRICSLPIWAASRARARPSQNTKQVQAGSGGFSPLFLGGANSPFSFFCLAAVTSIHIRYHLPMLITQLQSIELFMEGKERRGICLPPSHLVPWGLTSRSETPVLPKRWHQHQQLPTHSQWTDMLLLAFSWAPLAGCHHDIGWVYPQGRSTRGTCETLCHRDQCRMRC